MKTNQPYRIPFRLYILPPSHCPRMRQPFGVTLWYHKQKDRLKALEHQQVLCLELEAAKVSTRLKQRAYKLCCPSILHTHAVMHPASSA